MKLKIFLPYLLLFFVSIGVFLLVLFPQEQLANHLNLTLNSPNTKVQGHIERIKPALPFSLELINSRFSMGNGDEVTPDSLKILITPDLLFGATRKVKFNSEILKGTLKGIVGIENSNPLVYKTIDLSMSGIEIGQFSYNTQVAEITLKCNLSGEYSFSKLNKKNEQGQGSFLIEDVSADLKNSLFNRLKIPKVDFSTIQIEFTQKGKNLHIEQINAKGSVINVQLKGRINLTSPTSSSRIALTGAILPDSPYLASFVNSALIRAAAKNVKKDGVRFSINGTLEQPRIKL